MNCLKCNRTIVGPHGYETSNILVAGEFPGDEEIRYGRPFVGKTGDVLEKELLRVNINLRTIRKTNLWLHEFKSSMYDEEKHFEWHLAHLLNEMRQYDHVLFLGSEMATVFLDEKITDVNSLALDCKYFPGKKVTFGLNPAAAFHGSMGEVRLAIEKFGRRVGVYNG